MKKFLQCGAIKSYNINFVKKYNMPEQKISGNEIIINHDLNTIAPCVIVFKKTDNKYQQVNLPFIISDANTIILDTTDVNGSTIYIQIF